jgi:hypothetical protein
VGAEEWWMWWWVLIHSSWGVFEVVWIVIE